ncbi:hypothetical protein [Mycolicibacterium mageritense]|uniref:hypothetical protein n=1 Tax=Mycolicibacterium mageritense TaxID=53462 RepID=UPI0011DBD7E9|nr:hypothetical protein [Mycolicibacterium mageritense]TXI53379.1 MAG: hypothetical protein E6Q55_35235 [Mycolicibacterium mageritense]
MFDERRVLGFLEQVRTEKKAHGTHAFYRVLPGNPPKMEAFTLPPAGARNPLIGLSHIAMATVIYVRYQPADMGINFRAFAFWPNETHAALFGDDGGAIESVPSGAENFPMMYLLLSRIAWGKPSLPIGYSPDNWILRAAMKEVVDDATSSDLPDGKEAVWRADDILRRGIAKRIAVLRRADDPVNAFAVEGQDDWTVLHRFAPFLGGIRWSDLDTASLATELGYTDDAARWWTAEGIGCLEQVDLPTVQQSLTSLKANYPVVEGNVWGMSYALERAITSDYVAPIDRLRARWHADDPLKLVHLTRKVVATNDNSQAPLLVGYTRTDTGQLQPVSRVTLEFASNSIGLDFTGVHNVGPADGVLLIGRSADEWTAQAVNREGEHGSAASSLDDDAHQFVAPVGDPEILAALRRVATGHARFDADCTPFELARRQIMYGLARTLESLPLDSRMIRSLAAADPESESDANEESQPNMIESLIDIKLVSLLNAHLQPLLAASYPDDQPVEMESSNDDLNATRLWERLTVALVGLRELRWTDMRIEPLATAWTIPMKEAKWWQAEGLGPRQALLIPEECESMMRCATVLTRAPEGSTLSSYLRGRLESLFGHDIPALWSLVQ